MLDVTKDETKPKSFPLATIAISNGDVVGMCLFVIPSFCCASFLMLMFVQDLKILHFHKFKV
jgi:hypothetical protein